MKLEVGMYCRYKNFQNKIKIAKIKGIQKADEVFQYDYIDFDNDDGELETNIVKASYNIIDILEVGDILVDDTNRKLEILLIDNELMVRNAGLIYDNNYYIPIKSIAIKSVITHEQMEQMAYKVGDK